jgi:hypothetical protein
MSAFRGLKCGLHLPEWVKSAAATLSFLLIVAIDDIHLVHEVLEQGISILDQNM